MYAHLRGTLTSKEPGRAVVECAGIGFELKISLSTFETLPELQTQTLIFTHLAVREDAHILYGFAGEDEKMMFLHLVSVSGVGGNTALTILSAFRLSELQTAITSGDVNMIKKVRGIGQKTAERIILELRDKVGTVVFDSGPRTAVSVGGRSSVRGDAIQALTGLGFPKAIIEKKVDEILKSQPDISLEELIKMSLK